MAGLRGHSSSAKPVLRMRAEDRDRIVWQDGDDHEIGSALLDPGAALSLAETIRATLQDALARTWAANGIRGNVTVADADRAGITRSNLNRCPLFGAALAAMASTPSTRRGPGQTTRLSASIAHTETPGDSAATSSACSAASAR